MEKVSIVTPVYNVEEYLQYSVGSLRQQTYSNIEIILVDDGSTDRSGEICDQYTQEDDRIRVFHVENGGQSRARNIGVQQASSDWIIFLDADDYYNTKAVEYLVALKDQYAVDLVVTSIVEVRDHQTDLIAGDFPLDDSKELDRHAALLHMFYGNSVGTGPGGKLYKKEILLQYPYPEGMIYEDLAIAYEHIAACKEIAVGNQHLYKYYRRAGSTVNSKYSDRLLNFYKAMEWNRAYVERDYPDDVEMKKAVNARYVFNGFHIVHAMLGSHMYKEIKKIRRDYSHYFGTILLDKHITTKNKLKYVLFLCSPRLYDIVRKKIG